MLLLYACTNNNNIVQTLPTTKVTTELSKQSNDPKVENLNGFNIYYPNNNTGFSNGSSVTFTWDEVDVNHFSNPNRYKFKFYQLALTYANGKTSHYTQHNQTTPEITLSFQLFSNAIIHWTVNAYFQKYFSGNYFSVNYNKTKVFYMGTPPQKIDGHFTIGYVNPIRWVPNIKIVESVHLTTPYYLFTYYRSENINGPYEEVYLADDDAGFSDRHYEKYSGQNDMQKKHVYYKVKAEGSYGEIWSNTIKFAVNGSPMDYETAD